MMSGVLAMVLAGGRGRRMDILCRQRPKPVLPFAGKFRVIDFTLSNCIHSGIGDVAVLVDYQRSQMAGYLRGWHLANSRTSKMAVLEPRGGCYRGTADAIYQNIPFIERLAPDLVLVLAGDHIYKMDYRRLIAFHRESGAAATVAVMRVPLGEAHRFGTLATGRDGRITEFVEKSSEPRSNLASMGIYVFDRDILLRRLAEDAARPDSPHDFGYAVLPAMVGRDRLFAYGFDGYWQDVGTVEAFYGASMELVGRRPAFTLDGSWPVFGEETGAPAPRVGPKAAIVDSITSGGCMVKGRVQSSILGPRVWVDEGAVVRDSVLMENVFVGAGSILDRCVADEGVSIGRSCTIGVGGAPSPGEGDITVLGKGVTLPDGAIIGRSCRIQPYSCLAGLVQAVPGPEARGAAFRTGEEVMVE